MRPAARFSQASRMRDWQRLRELLGRVQSGSLGVLSDQELWELPGLYRKAMSDLSLLRTTGAAPDAALELAQLCSRAHALIYRETAERRGPGVIHYVVNELPRAVRRRIWYVLGAAIVMALFSVLGWLHCELNPKLAQTVLSPQMVSGIESSLKAARKQADLKLAAQIPAKERNAAALMITFNNIGVSVRGFVFGIAGGVPTIIVLAINGYLLGAIAYVYFHTAPGIPINLPLYFVAGIAPHGAIELPAICLACAAGMLIGFAWLFPGQRTRGTALREAAVDAGRLVVACSLTLVVAGSIEGFVTPLLPPLGFPLTAWFIFKIAVGALVFSCWLLWLGLGGRVSAVPS